MPRKITSDMPFDDDENEILFTQGGLAADPDGASFLPQTADWMSLVDSARAQDRAARGAVMTVDAKRMVANARLDDACIKFGDEHWLDVGKDVASKRWTQFVPASLRTMKRFVKTRLLDQATKVRTWLSADEPALKKHKATLDTWSQASLDAIEQTHGLAMVRGKAQIAREQMAEDLTKERDGLHDALAAHARENGLPRDWADQFFRVTRRANAPAGGDQPDAPPVVPPAGGG